MKTVSLYAYAKLNLALEVVGKREDGYHDMDMLMQSVSLCDTIHLNMLESGIRFTCNRSDLPCNSDNIAFAAAEKFFSFTGISGGVEISLEKQIPSQAGMAGGSADAAAVLHGLNRLYATDLSVSELCRVGVTLGADVPFCLVGGTAHVTGMGEKVEPAPPLPECFFIIVKPETGISTGAAFQAVDRCQSLQKADVQPVLDAAAARDMKRLALAMCNTFEQVTELEEVFEIKKMLLESGACGSLMSGSGSAVFGLFAERETALAAVTRLRHLYKEVYFAEPVSYGVKVL
jgi:4-diphosphocytidyl-2-C-methyl-D-erythritol kinase